MKATTVAPGLDQLAMGGHASWTVHDDESYLTGVERLLGLAEQRSEKAVLFGPEPTTLPAGLTRRPAACADPRTAFLDGGPLVPATMFAALGHQIDLARRDGYSGLMVVADMDWLLPLEPSQDEIISFELLLDRCISEVGATVVCAYRSNSFDPQTLTGTACVHPTDADQQPPLFRLVADTATGWRLSGEVDRANAHEFQAALHAAAGDEGCDIEISGLEFIDASGMRVIAAEASTSTICLLGARPIIRRSWKVSGFADQVPAVKFVD
jgi:anti-anti-sigma factor